MHRHPPTSKRTYTPLPYTTLFRSEQLGRIVEMVAVDERRRKQPEPRFHLLRDGLGEQDDIVRGFVTDPVPQSAVAGIVVIAREQPPAAGIALHARDCLEIGREHV